jgi:sulfur-oxidizing protein SoxY
MREVKRISILNRRSLVISAAAAGLAPFLACAESSPATALDRSQRFKDDFARILAGNTPIEHGIVVDLPETAENGNFVPVTISIDSPMTEADHVRAIHLLSTANPFAHVATFRLAPINGVARVQSRMRLAKTQDVVTLAELSTGQMLMATTLVNVTIGGCGS